MVMSNGSSECESESESAAIRRERLCCRCCLSCAIVASLDLCGLVGQFFFKELWLCRGVVLGMQFVTHSTCVVR